MPEHISTGPPGPIPPDTTVEIEWSVALPDGRRLRFSAGAGAEDLAARNYARKHGGRAQCRMVKTTPWEDAPDEH